MADAALTYSDRLAALAADLNGIDIPVSPRRELLLYARVVWAAGERLDSHQPLAPIHYEGWAQLLRSFPASSEEESLLASIAIARLLWGADVVEDPARESSLLAHMASVRLAAEEVQQEPDLLRSFVKKLGHEEGDLALGPGFWMREVGREVSLEDRPTSQPAMPAVFDDAIETRFDLEKRLARLTERSTVREREVLAALKSNPDATARELGEALGCAESTARTFKQLIRRKAAGL